MCVGAFLYLPDISIRERDIIHRLNICPCGKKRTKWNFSKLHLILQIKVLNLTYFFYSKYKNGKCLNWLSLLLFKHLDVYTILFMYCFQFCNSIVWYTDPCTLSVCLLSLNEEGTFWSLELHGVILCISIQLENDWTHFLILYCKNTFSMIQIRWFSEVKLLELLT